VLRLKLSTDGLSLGADVYVHSGMFLVCTSTCDIIGYILVANEGNKNLSNKFVVGGKKGVWEGSYPRADGQTDRIDISISRVSSRMLLTRDKNFIETKTEMILRTGISVVCTSCRGTIVDCSGTTLLVCIVV